MGRVKNSASCATSRFPNPVRLVNFRCPRKLIRRLFPGWSVLPAVPCLSKVLQAWSSVVLTSEKILPGSPVGFTVGTGDVPLHYHVSLIIGTLAIGVSCVVAICAVETSTESWNNSASGSIGEGELMTAPQVYQTKARAHVVLMPALLVTIMGFLGSLHWNSHLLAIYVVAVTPFVLLPLAIPALCNGPETTIKHLRAAPRAVDVLEQGMGEILAAPSNPPSLCPQYVSSFLDVMLVGDLTPLWTWTSWSGPVLVNSIISAARLYEATSRAEHAQGQLVQDGGPGNALRMDRTRGRVPRDARTAHMCRVPKTTPPYGRIL
ncbi:hypothetical protein MRX96_011211 [Rhipicephalus microplus]